MSGASQEFVFTLTAKIVRLEEVLRDLIDPDPCSFDHHGYCQAHTWLTDESECPQARAKRLLGESE